LSISPVRAQHFKFSFPFKSISPLRNRVQLILRGHNRTFMHLILEKLYLHFCSALHHSAKTWQGRSRILLLTRTSDISSTKHGSACTMTSDGSFFESRRECDTFAVSYWILTFSYRTLLNNASHDRQTSIATNLLSILENLNTFPTEPGELNSWWVPGLGVKSLKKTTVAGVLSDSNSDDSSEADEEDDWRKFFDEPTPTSESAAKAPGTRLHKMTIHQSVHSLSSHRAVFTRTWLTLLPRLSGIGHNDVEPRKPLIVKALNIMHRSVLPHLTRPILVMDWVGTCVDYGG